MIRLFTTFWLCTVLVLSTRAQGINFNDKSSWAEIKKMAREEGKYIFIDCYATWCIPCKLMDKQVYPNDTVGSFMNARFISIKMQMDTSSTDDLIIKRRYSDAKLIAKTFNIKSYPTYLFISPDGELVHKAVGYKDASQLISASTAALDSARQYFTLLKKELKELTTSQCREVAMLAQSFNDTALANKAAFRYITEHLARLNKKEFLTKENIRFLLMFTKRSTDPGFKMLLAKSPQIKTLMGEDKSVNMALHFIIYVDDLEPQVLASQRSGLKELDWKGLENKLARKYNEYFAQKVVYETKIRWYRSMRNSAKRGR